MFEGGVQRVSANTYEFKSGIPSRLALSPKLETTVKIKGCAYDRLMYRVMVMVAIQYVHSRGRVDARFIYVLCALIFCIPHWCFSYMLCGASLTVKFCCSMLCSCFHEGAFSLNAAAAIVAVVCCRCRWWLRSWWHSTLIVWRILILHDFINSFYGPIKSYVASNFWLRIRILFFAFSCLLMNSFLFNI